MSIEQARAFVEKTKTDKALLKEVMAISDLPGRINMINKRGFKCNENEIKQVHKEFVKLTGDNCIPLVPKLAGCPEIWCPINEVIVTEKD